MEATDNSVYVHAEQGGTSIVVALDIAKGTKKWEVRGGESGYVYGPTEGNGLVFFGQDNGTVRGHDPHTYEKKWEFRGSEATSVKATLDGTVYLAYGDQGDRRGVLAVKMADASKQWMFPTKSAPGPVVAAGGLLYTAVPEDGIYAIDPASGGERWSFPLTRTGSEIGLTVFGDGLFASTGTGVLYALPAATGGGR